MGRSCGCVLTINEHIIRREGDITWKRGKFFEHAVEEGLGEQD